MHCQYATGRGQPVIATALVMVASSCKRRRPNARSTSRCSRASDHSTWSCRRRILLRHCTEDAEAHLHHLPRGEPLWRKIHLQIIFGAADLQALWASTQGAQARLEPRSGRFCGGGTRNGGLPLRSTQDWSWSIQMTRRCECHMRRSTPPSMFRLREG